MADEGKIVVPFSFPIDPNVGELLSSIKKLKEETQNLSKSLIELPIDELRTKQQAWIDVLGRISTETLNANQANKQHQALLSTNLDLVNQIIAKLQTNIDLQKLFNAEGAKQQAMIDKVNKETLKAVSSLDALNQKMLEGSKLTQIEINNKEKYSATIQKNTNLLTLFNAGLKDNSAMMKQNSETVEVLNGHIKLTETLIKNLTESWKALSEEELKDTNITKYYSETLGNLNVQLKGYQNQINGTLDSEMQLQKVREQNIIIENKINALGEVDIDVKARQIIENDKLNQAIQNRVKILDGTYAKQIEDASLAEQKELAIYTEKINKENTLAYEQYEKEKELNSKKLADTEARLTKQARLEELNYSKIWLAAEKSYGKIWNSAEQCYIKSGEAAEVAGRKAVFSFENIAATAERMGLRTIISFAYWTILIGSAMKLYEWWSKVSDAEQMAIDRLSSYKDSIKGLVDQLISSDDKTNANVAFKSSSLKSQLSIMQDNSLTPDQRYRAYKKITGIAEGVFDDMDVDTFEKKGVSQSQVDNMYKYIALQEKIESARSNQNSVLQKKADNITAQRVLKDKIRNELRSNGYDDVSKKFGHEMTDDELEDFVNRSVSSANPNSETTTGFSTDFRDLKRLQIQAQNFDPGSKKYDDEASRAEADQAKLQGNVKHPKGARGKSVLDQMLQEEEAAYKLRQDIAKSEFEESNRSFQDRKNLYDKENSNAREHYNNQKDIIEDYAASSGKTKTEIRTLDKKFQDEETKEFKDREKNMKDDLLAFKRYNDENAKIIEETTDRILKNSEQNRRRIEQINETDRKGKLSVKKARRFNALGAFLGTGGGTPEQDFKDDIAEMDKEIASAKRNVDASAKAGESATAKVQSLSIGLFEDNRVPDEQKSPDQKLQYQEDLKKYKIAVDEKDKIDEQFSKNVETHTKLVNDRQAAIDLHTKEGKIALAQELFNATEKIANAGFDAQKKRIEMQMQSVQEAARFEMELAGNNSSAKIKIAREEHEKMKSLRRQQAQLEKEQAIFSIIISTAQGIASAWKVGNPIVSAAISAVVAAVGVAEIAKVSSAPLPAYKFGRKGGKEEFARINEDGFEIISDKSGKKKLLGRGEDSIVKLNYGDTVHTHKESLAMIEDQFLKSLLIGTGVVSQSQFIERRDRLSAIKSNSISREDMEDIMVKAISKIPNRDIVIPADHVIKGYWEQRARHNLNS